MIHKGTFVGFLQIALLCACSSASMSGTPKLEKPTVAASESQQSLDASTSPSPVLDSASTGADDNLGTVPTPEPSVPTPEPSVPIPAPTPAPTPAPAPITPDGVVDGEDVINDCGRCIEHAKELAAEINFTADAAKTYNEGHYKIPRSEGLCDIHFMRDMRDEIADHDGRDSILGNQVAVYCPCNCGWPHN